MYSTTMQTYGSIRKGISIHDTKHQILICKRYISEEVKKDIANIKQLPNFFVSQTKQVISMKCLNNTIITFS